MTQTTSPAIRHLEWIIAQHREAYKTALASLANYVQTSPASIFQWGQNYYVPMVQAGIADRIQKAYDQNMHEYDVSDPNFDPNRWYDALALVIDELVETLTSNRLIANGSSAFGNACTEVEREATAQMLRELRGAAMAFKMH